MAMPQGKLSPAHQLLLSQFRNAREVPASGHLSGHSVEEWQTALRQPLSAAISTLVSQGLLQEATLDQTLAALLKMADLKERVSLRGLPVSGKKADLAARLAQSDPLLASSLTKGHAVFKSTELGDRLIAQFHDAAESSRTTMEKTLIDLLQHGEFRKAVVTLASFEASQVFPRGMGVDWGHYDPARDEKILRLIFTRVPKSLAQARHEYLPTCRVGAAMSHLVWNVGQTSTWLCSSIPGETENRLIKIANDLRSHALFLEKIESLRESPFRHRVTVLTCNDQGVCASCRALAQKTYSPSNVPEFPNPACLSTWCRCGIGSELT